MCTHASEGGRSRPPSALGVRPPIYLSDTSGIPSVNLPDTSGIPSVNLSDTSGIPSVNLPDTSGIPSVNLSDTSGIPSVNLSDTSGIPSVNLPDTSGIPSVNLPDTCRTPVSYLPAACRTPAGRLPGACRAPAGRLPVAVARQIRLCATFPCTDPALPRPRSARRARGQVPPAQGEPVRPGSRCHGTVLACVPAAGFGRKYHIQHRGKWIVFVKIPAPAPELPHRSPAGRPHSTWFDYVYQGPPFSAPSEPDSQP